MTSFTKATVALGACALILSAADFWNTKDYKDWTDQDVNQMLTKSPWTAETKTVMDSSGMQQRGGSTTGGMPGGMGGGGIGGGGIGGGGIGGGGIGGGGIGGGGIGGGGIGGGGIGGGGMGGRGRNSGGYPGGASRGVAQDVTVRWDSALPVRQALMKSHSGDAEQLNAPQKNYVISVTGLRVPNRRASDDDQEQPQEADTNSGRQGRDPSQMRNMLMSTTRLARKDKDPIAPQDVKIEGGTIQFLFPRSDAIRVEDKEVTFITQVGRAKVERKFKLKDMVYKGQLEL